MARARIVLHAAEYTFPSVLASHDAMCAKPTNFSLSATSTSNDCAISTQTYHGNTGNSHPRELSKTSRDAYEDARASSTNVAPPPNPLDSPKAQWTFDPRNGAPFRAPLKLCITISKSYFSPYTGLAWTPSPRQLAPNTNQYTPLQIVI